MLSADIRSATYYKFKIVMLSVDVVVDRSSQIWEVANSFQWPHCTVGEDHKLLEESKLVIAEKSYCGL